MDGFPEVKFEMDNDRTYLNKIVYIHEVVENVMSEVEQVKPSNEVLNENKLIIIELIIYNSLIKQKDIIDSTKISKAQVQCIMKNVTGEKNICT